MTTQKASIDSILNTTIWGNGVEIMKSLPSKSVDLICTDPPYNAKNIGPNSKVYLEGEMQMSQKEYKKFCKEWFKQALRVGKRVIFTPGIANTHNYPQPWWQIAWYKPAATSYNRMGGFNVWEPIFIYGGQYPGKRITQDYIVRNVVNFKKTPESRHPCPKQLSLILFIISKFSKKGDIVMDPMMGSGTTLVACKMLQRRYVGVDKVMGYKLMTDERLRQENLEIADEEEKYCEQEKGYRSGRFMLWGVGQQIWAQESV